MAAGSTVDVAVTADPADATIAATSSDEAVATVAVADSTITVTGVAVGTATVTVTASAADYADGTATFDVEVTEAPVALAVESASADSATTVAVTFNQPNRGTVLCLAIELCYDLPPAEI